MPKEKCGTAAENKKAIPDRMACGKDGGFTVTVARTGDSD
ncbi:Uncharacterised protein [Serratia marcescens]|nr:Uncharacterised protein [Serratia marcescens]CAI2474862.1 Uncharacterised protein [Serratia marcescens]